MNTKRASLLVESPQYHINKQSIFSKKVMWRKQEGCISWIDTAEDQRDEYAVLKTVPVDISVLTRRLQ